MVSGIGGSKAALSLLACVERRATGEAQQPVGATQASAQAGTAALASSGQAGNGGAGMGGATASSSGSESTDYIAEADTNNDRKVSEQERIAYEKKQGQRAGKSAHGAQEAGPAQRSREQEVRQAYMPQAAQAGLDVIA